MKDHFKKGQTISVLRGGIYYLGKYVGYTELLGYESIFYIVEINGEDALFVVHPKWVEEFPSNELDTLNEQLIHDDWAEDLDPDYAAFKKEQK